VTKCCRCDGNGYTFVRGSYGRPKARQDCGRCRGTGKEPQRLKPLYSERRVKARLEILRAERGCGETEYDW
jgi:hypothetical protein